MKRCLYCAEEIQDEAIKCRYCHEMLTGPRPPMLPAPSAVPWYCRSSTLAMGFLMAGPLIIPLIWIHPQLGRPAKWGLTVLISVASILLAWITVRSLRGFLDYYRLLQQM